MIESEQVESLKKQLKLTQEALTKEQADSKKLQAFKDWVHSFLDTHGVPHHPPGSHGAAGCRIGDRMDWLMARVQKEE